MNPIDEEAVGPNRRGALARLRWPLMIGGPVIILVLVAWFLLTGGRFESTDDAYVQVGKAPISAAIAGRVIEVDVKENEHVKAGQVLFKLDDADQTAAAAKADAALASARLQVAALRAAYTQQQLQLSQALTTQSFSTREAGRQKALVTAGVASRQQAAAAGHTADVDTSNVMIARQQVATALTNLGEGAKNPEAFPGVLQAKAERVTAQVDLNHTVVHAPQDGVVTRVDQLQVGAYVNPSETLFFLLSGEPWVEANFKENQLTHMRVGQPAEIVVDALGGRKLAGHVASFSPGSGSAFSALPAQNATGNWVKVAQRLPVRIAFDKAPPEVAGRAGLSAKVTVDVRSGRK
ncbi:MAG TPA: HlyD family secretion protein [Caulobacteraceae bacterium]|nr:HlyD family secretion protein [Caulobacteraceae bacterium]